MRVAARLEPESLDAVVEYSRFLNELSGEGAVVSFAGVARPQAKNGTAVTHLFLDHHPRLTQTSLEEIAHEAARRFAISAVRIVHRCGQVEAGEAIVFVAAASAHRRASFDAADYMMDRLKTDAVFWKREQAESGPQWIEPTEADRSERARWSE